MGPGLSGWPGFRGQGDCVGVSRARKTNGKESAAGGPDLSVEIAGIRMKNPVMVASGIFGYGDEFRGLADYGELGCLVLKTITREPRPGNPPAHRTAETPAGMINAIGLENVGLDVFLRDKLPSALSYGTNVVASIALVKFSGSGIRLIA